MLAGCDNRSARQRKFAKEQVETRRQAKIVALDCGGDADWPDLLPKKYGMAWTADIQRVLIRSNNQPVVFGKATLLDAMNQTNGPTLVFSWDLPEGNGEILLELSCTEKQFSNLTAANSPGSNYAVAARVLSVRKTAEGYAQAWEAKGSLVAATLMKINP